MKTKVLLIIMGVTLFALGSALYRQESDDSSTQALDAVKRIIKQSCGVTGCHSGKYPAANLNLEPEKFPTSAAGVLSLGMPDLKIVDPGAPEKSYLLAKVRGASGIVGKRMPMNRDPLTEEQIRRIEEWIKSLAGNSPF